MGWVNPLNKKIVTKIFFTATEWISKNLWKKISADILHQKVIKTIRNKRSGGSILQICIRRTFRTWNTSFNNVKNSKKIPTAEADVWHYFYRIHFCQVFRDFLTWYPSCACAAFSSRTSTKIVSFCSQFRENFPDTVILLISLNIILWH